MKKVRSFTSIWNVEKVIYAINDLPLPFPVTFSQMAWFVGSFFIILLFSSVPPLSLIDSALVKYIALPVIITVFMSRKTFDGKKPYSFLKSAIAYYLRPKLTYAGKPVRLRKASPVIEITAVRSEIFVPN